LAPTLSPAVRWITIAFVWLAGLICISVSAFSLTNESRRGWLDFYAWRYLSGKAHGGYFAPVVGDVSIYYETYGAGPPVLVMHGGLGAHEDMRNQIRALADTHLVIAPDSRGQGRSTDSDMQMTYSVMADDMVQLLDRLRIPKVDVVGWSDGGITGLDLAMRYPARVRRLIAISANFHPTGVQQNLSDEVDIPPTPIRYRAFSKTPERWLVVYRKVTKMWRTQPNYSIEDLRHIKLRLSSSQESSILLDPQIRQNSRRRFRAAKRSLSRARRTRFRTIGPMLSIR
jgi:pimeloyl-ACP methyl ester carboxylesterase